MNEVEAMSKAVEASIGLPVATPADFAHRLLYQLRRLGYALVGPQVDDCDGLGCSCCSKLQALCPQPVDNLVEGS